MASDEVADDEKRIIRKMPMRVSPHPIMDLSAAAIVALIAIFMAVESLRLPVPGGVIFTAPGLLPFLTSASLLMMALLLGYSAITRRRITPRALDRFEIPTDAMRSLTLGGIVVLYVLALQFVPFGTSFNIGSLHFCHRRLRAGVGRLPHRPAAGLLAGAALGLPRGDRGVDRLPLDRVPHAVPNSLAVRRRP